MKLTDTTSFSGFFTRVSKAVNRRLINANFNLYNREDRKRSVIELEKLFFDIVKKSGVGLFLEVGAKDAGASRYIAANQSDKDVIAFEANPYTFKHFNKQYDYKSIGVDYRNMALTEQNGTVKINVRKNIKGAPIADGQASLLKHKTYEFGHVLVEVRAFTVDEVLQQTSNKEYALWMDVEGALEPVLKGAKKTLASLQVAFIEVETKVFWAGQWLKSDVDKFFKSAGFVPFARDYQSRWQCNVIYIPEHLSHADFVQQAFSDYQKRIGIIDGKPLSDIKILKNLIIQSRTFQKTKQKVKKLIS